MDAWLSKLEEGNEQAAWNLFEPRYRRLIFATIRRLLHAHDDVMDVYATVCAALTADGAARLRHYSVKSPSGAAVSTWLVIVVRNLTIDWIRKGEGRRRHVAPPELTGTQRALYEALCIAGLSRVEAFEVVCSRTGLELTFPAFLREVSALRATHPCPELMPPRRPEPMPVLPEIPVSAGDPAEVSDLAVRLAAALATQPPDVRLAVQLFVVDELKAADVAAVVGWPNAKAVYNRVTRALLAMRGVLEREGVLHGDL